MDRFLLAENPINTDDVIKQYIIHTIKPKCIIEAVNASDDSDVVSSGFPHQIFEFINSDGVPEIWALIVRDVYDHSSSDEIEKLLSRAWRWFRAYMEWEDGNIDEQEASQWN
ncbi:hypothetical protein [Gaoshiqia sediminis]|uniref:Uncharacterized protein n=1 Tax=Gaoshiqia sediminis TaxID=2986998 RepID=A0AA42C7Z6_9BACT|nr:hypothetical protein [Gaoshiqia sediminis]MCW0484084.1 hypothetical protein [Gaoshiqia sediminis]